jgi:hypothetical protein
MPDSINAGDESDRCLVCWPLAGERAVAASRGPVPEPDLDALRRAGATLLVQVPGDIVGMRRPSVAAHGRILIR